MENIDIENGHAFVRMYEKNELVAFERKNY